jgi:D-xylose 1-dehydrogenase (NADP+, D-xylono-1,5-lactone-forming)
MKKRVIFLSILILNIFNICAQKLRWGLLSTARFNTTIINALRLSDRSEIVAVASRSLEKAQNYAKEKNIPVAYGSYEELLADKNIDIIYNPLPNSMHGEWTIKAIEAGKHVLCEKPFVTKLEEIDKIIDLSTKNKVVVFEAFVYLHHPQTLKILEIINSGKIGEVQVINSWFSFILSPDDKLLGTIRLDPQLDGGCMWDLGAYTNSAAITMAQAGAPKEVWATQVKGPTGVDIITCAQLNFSNGVIAQISASFNTPYRKGLQIVGSKGILDINNPWQPGRDGKETYIQFSNNLDVKETYTIPATNPYIYEIHKMEACVLDGEQPLVTLERSRDFLRSLLAIYKSAELGQLVKL